MNPDKINAAAEEARRFLDRVDAAANAFTFQKFGDQYGGYYSNTNTVATAALRRASLDLTRALAELRKAEQ